MKSPELDIQPKDSRKFNPDADPDKVRLYHMYIYIYVPFPWYTRPSMEELTRGPKEPRSSDPDFVIFGTFDFATFRVHVARLSHQQPTRE